MAALVRISFVCATLVALSGCVGTSEGLANKHGAACIFEGTPPGAYAWNDGDDVVTAADKGTAEGAALLNACIQRKAAAAGEIVSPVAAIETGTTLPYTPQPVADAPAPAQTAAKPVPPVTSSTTAAGSCSLTLTGGTGYACTRN